MKHVKLFEEFVNKAKGEVVKNHWLDESVEEINEEISEEAVYIHHIIDCGQEAAQNFIDDNNIDPKKLVDYVKKNRDSKEKYEVRDIIAGTGVGQIKSFREKFIKSVQENLNESKGQLIDKALAKAIVDHLAMKENTFEEVYYLSLFDRETIKRTWNGGRFPNSIPGPTKGALAGSILTPLAGNNVYVDGGDLVKGDHTVLRLSSNTTWADVKQALDI